jgi:hypothetical protein
MIQRAGLKRKGDVAEREVLAFLRDHLGDHLVRARLEGDNDHGDVSGLPEMTVQVKNYADVARAVRDGIADVVVQKANAGTQWGCAFVRRRGGHYVVCMTPEDFISLYREAVLGRGA